MNDGPYIKGTIPGRREKRDSKKYPYKGKMHRLSDIAVDTGIPTNTLRVRLASGKSYEEAFANTDYRGGQYKRKVKSRALKHEFEGEMLTMKEISKRTGIMLATLYSRYYSGWSMEEMGLPVDKRRQRKGKKNDGDII